MLTDVLFQITAFQRRPEKSERMGMNAGACARRAATKMRLIVTWDIITAAGVEAIAHKDGVIVQLYAQHHVHMRTESNGAIVELMKTDVGWETIAQLSALIPLLLLPSNVEQLSFIAGEENMKTTAFQ